MTVIPVVSEAQANAAPAVDGWHSVGTLETLFGDKNCAGLTLEGVKVGVFNIDGEISALDDICTHGAALLSEGYIEDGQVECPLHGGLVDIKTGKACTSPIVRDTRVHQVRIEEGQVFIKLHATE